jgi:hypothetical protein
MVTLINLLVPYNEFPECLLIDHSTREHVLVLVLCLEILLEELLQMQSREAWQADVWFCSITHGQYK